ncbi:hypothetical protein CUR21_03695 [Pseudorhodobacter sp. MZDSW-24AT]|nr:hypothetical protein CUR21_03695 [Pseudorhodobacter sp. MZDSW-24AT]
MCAGLSGDPAGGGGAPGAARDGHDPARGVDGKDGAFGDGADPVLSGKPPGADRDGAFGGAGHLSQQADRGSGG